jgi:RNA polymerase sigma factor (sigma-70 family)
MTQTTSHSKEDLLLQYESTVRAVVNRLLLNRHLVNLPIDREDLYQVAWMALIQCYPHFDKSRGVKFETYASTVIVNAVNREIKKYSLRRMSNIIIDIEDENQDMETQLEFMSELISIVESGKVLDRTEREIFWHRFIDEKTFSEIGTLFDVSRETARKVYNKSLEKLKKAVK